MKIIKLLLTIMFLSFAWVTYAQVTVGIPDLAVTGSGSVKIPIKVTNFNDVGAISLVINYDPSVLTFQGVPNPLSGNFLANAANGQIIVSWFGLTPLNIGNGDLIELSCNYNGNGTSALAFDKAKSEITNSAGTPLTNTNSFTNGSIFLASSQPVSFSIPATNLTTTGADVNVPVNVTNYNNIGATTLKISYNPSVLTFKGLANAPAGFTASASSGVINVSYSTATAFTFGNGKLFDLKFNYVGGNSDLKFVQATASNILSQALTVNKTDGTVTGPAAPVGAVTMTLPDTNVSINSSLELPVTVENFNNIGSISLKINYNKNVLTFKNIANTFSYGNGQWQVGNDAVNGVVTIGWNSTDAVTPINIQKGKLLDLQFDFKEGSSPLTVSAETYITNITNAPVAVNYVNGMVSAPRQIALGNIKANINDIVNVPLTVNNLTNVGSVSISFNYDPSVIKFIGLANNPNQFYSTNPSAANGTIVIGWSSQGGSIPPLNVVSGKVLDLQFQYIDKSTPLTFNQAQCLITDVNLNAISGITYLNGSVSKDISFELAKVRGNVNSDVAVPVKIKNITKIGSMSLQFTYDPALVTFKEVKNFNGAAGTLQVNSPSSGVLKIGFADVNPLNVLQSKIFDLVFTYKTSAVAEIKADVVNCEITDTALGKITGIVYIDGSISPNMKPVISSVAPKVVAEGASLKFNLTVSDPESDPVNVTLANIPADAKVVKTATPNVWEFSWNPNFAQAGSYVAKFTAADSIGAIDTSSVVISVTNTPQPITFTKVMADTTIKENQALAFSYKASSLDEQTDGMVMKYKLQGAPANMTIDANGQIAWTPDFKAAEQNGGIYTFQVIAFGNTLEATANAKITVQDTPQQITFTTTMKDTTIKENQAIAFNYKATSPDEVSDGLVIKYKLTGAPAGAAIDAAGKFTWTPDYTAAELNGGVYNFQVVAFGNGTEAISNAKITVQNVNRKPSFTKVMPDANINENQELTFQYEATDPDAGAVLTYKLAKAPQGAVISTDGKFAWTPTFEQAGTYDVIAVVSDGDLTDTSKTTVVVVKNVNRKPVFTKVMPDANINENQELAFQYEATDPDAGAVLTYKLAKAPAGAVMTAAGKFTWTPTFEQAGTYDVIAVVSDGDLTDTSKTTVVVVKNVNRKPVFTKVMPDANINENQELAFQYEATDPDTGSVLTFKLAKAPQGAVMTAAGKFTWTPTFEQAGTYDVVAVVSDGDLTDTSKTTIVVVKNVNRVPKFTKTLPDTTINENQALAYTFAATDADAGTTLTYSLSGAPAGAAITAAGAFTWTPTYDQAGTHTFKAYVSDGTDKDSANVKITVVNVNRAPKFTKTMADTTINENQALAYTYAASDPDAGTTLAYSVVGAPTGLAMNATTGELTWKPGLDQAGTYTFKAFVSDGTLKDSANVKITVTNVNQAPVFTTKSLDTTVNENQALAYTFKATDADAGATLAYSLVGAPTGATINASTGAFAWTPTYDQAGTYNFKAVVTDGTLNDTATVKVLVKDVDRAPKFTKALADTTIKENQALAYTFAAVDPDGKAITYSLSGAPTGAAIIAATGAFTWTPNYTQAGTYNFKVFATDGTLKDSANVKITVTNVNQKPVFTKALPADTSYKAVSGNIGTQFKYTYAGTSPEGKPLTFFIKQAPTGSSIAASTGAFVWDPGRGTLAAGDYTITIGLTDGIDTVFTTSKVNVPVPMKILIEAGIPTEYAMSQNFPNPFNPTTYIKYSIPKESMVSVKVYNMIGQEVMTLVNEMQTVGNYAIEFNASKLASGTYIYRIQADKFVSVKKMILVK